MNSWLKRMFCPVKRTPFRRRPRRGTKPTLEILEDRLTPNTSFVVMNTADSGTGSLRDAIAMATTDAGNDTITFAPALTASGPATINLSTVGGTFTFIGQQSNSALKITTPITIQGPSGANGITIARDTSVASLRMFQVDGGNLTLNGVTLTGGLLPLNLQSTNVGQQGGALLVNGGTATLQSCTVSGNKAVRGGALVDTNSGTLNITNSTVTNNQALPQTNLNGYGGAVYDGSGTVVIIGSSFSGNSGNDGGALDINATAQISDSTFSGNNSNLEGGAIDGLNAKTLALVNCTISGNTTGGAGGAIFSGGNLSLLNCTVTGNRAASGTATLNRSYGGGIAIEVEDPTVLRNTIVAGNLAGTGTTPDDIKGAVDPSSKYNLIGVSANLTGITNGSQGNQIGSVASPLSAKLGMLQNNGGSTLTMAPLVGSLAIDAGDPSTTGLPATDQRDTGFPRVVGNAVDIGAVESSFTGPTPQVVTTTADSGAGSLRQAILNANAASGRTTITFNIATSGVQTITPVTPLLAVTQSVVIDATTEPGYAGTPLVVLDGSQVGGGNGLALVGGNSAVQGLAIDHFSNQAAGLVLASNNNAVLGDFVGVKAAGTTAAGNYYGIYVPAGAGGNTIGGTTAATRNVVSGNTLFGILLEGSSASGNVVQGDFLGTDASGSVALPNGLDGVAVVGASGNTIGGATSPAANNLQAGNLISGNGRFGVFLTGAGASGNIVEGNFVGLNQAGAAKLPNAFDGVTLLSGANSNTVGGTASVGGNFLSGNGRFGLLLGTNNNLVAGNIIGTDINGSVALANALDGIGVVGGANNTIGGTTGPASNFILGNARFGIFVDGATATGNAIQGNYLGAAPMFSAPGNVFDGIVVLDGARSNTIGGTAAGLGNTLAGNGRFGIYLADSGTSGNVVQGNTIGTAGGFAKNASDGVELLSGASGNTIGGTVSGAGNTIAGNGRVGVLLGVAGTSGNLVEGNFIGTDKTGTTGLGNTAGGVGVLTGASGNTIGGTLAGAGNTITNNGGPGVIVGATASDAGTVGDSVLGNAISANAGSNGLGIDLGDNGTTANGSGPSGPNHFQNHPVIQSAALNTGNTVSVNFTLPSLPSSTFRVEFFLNNPASPSQGLIFLGTVNVTTDATGAASSVTGGGSVNAGVVSVTLTPPSGVTASTGQSVTATATLLTTQGSTGTPGDTSEFSTPVAIVSAP